MGLVRILQREREQLPIKRLTAGMPPAPKPPDRGVSPSAFKCPRCGGVAPFICSKCSACPQCCRCYVKKVVGETETEDSLSKAVERALEDWIRKHGKLK